MRPAIVRRAAALLLLLAMLVFTAAAQESGPSEPDQTEIVIPEFVLRVQELGVEEVEAVLPGEAELALGQIMLPLPGADELTVSDIAFDAPMPTVTASGRQPSVFSTGRLGAGTANRVLGELSIYKLGNDPRFRLGFAHEGLDGFQFNEPGTGFYAFTNSIDAWSSVQREKVEFEGEIGFVESETGLQNLSDNSAVAVRATDTAATLTYLPDPLITVTADLDAGMATRLQTTSSTTAVPRDQEYALSPAAGARINVRALDLMFSTSYFLRFMAGNTLPLQQDLDFHAGFEAALPWSMVIGGQAGVHWDFAAGLAYPWYLSVRGLIGDALEYGVTGGFRVQRTTLNDLWDIEPLIATGDAINSLLVSNNIWYASADTRWTGGSGLSIRSEMEFTSESAALELLPYDTVADEFPFYQRQLMFLTPSVAAAWQPSQVWQFELGWTGSFLNRTILQPFSAVEGAVRFSGRSGVFRADLEIVSEYHPEPEMPWLGLTGTVAAGEGVELVLEFSDLLAPLLDPGRPRYGSAVSAAYPFIEPGFVASIFTRITL